MTKSTLYNLTRKFKSAMLSALHDKRFDSDVVFRDFPLGCCGDTCYLLSEYLLSKGIETIYVCGYKGIQSHAWLVLKDSNINNPTPYTFNDNDLPDDIKSLLTVYAGSKPDSPNYAVNYKECDIQNGIIIDITADQFGEQSVYVGYLDEFHKQFRFDSAHDYGSLSELPRLLKLYSLITEYIS